MEKPTTADAALPRAVVVMEAREDMVELLRSADAHVARACAARIRVVHDLWLVSRELHTLTGHDGGVRFRGPDELSFRSLRAEVATALRIAESSAEELLAAARMIDTHPATFAALESGEISERHARVIVDASLDLDEADRAKLEALALERARTLTPGRLKRRLRDARERLFHETAIERHKAAVEQRGVWLDSGSDGMAHLSALLPMATADAIYDRLTSIARGLGDVPEEVRTLPQRRADVLADILLTGDGTGGLGSGIRGSVHLTVPVLSLLGHSDAPAELHGHGPIDIETARRLTAEAPSFTRILTHPESGAVLSVGRERYRPTEQLRTWLRLRDGTCRFPGCAQPAARCDIDHTTDWAAGGATESANLAHLCRGHHSLKHNSAWSVRQVDDLGTLEWTSPLGAVHVTDPAVRIRPAPAGVDWSTPAERMDESAANAPPESDPFDFVSLGGDPFDFDRLDEVLNQPDVVRVRERLRVELALAR